MCRTVFLMVCLVFRISNCASSEEKPGKFCEKRVPHFGKSTGNSGANMGERFRAPESRPKKASCRIFLQNLCNGYFCRGLRF